MSKARNDFVLVVQAPARALGDGTFVTESAFATHLKALRDELGDDFDRLVVLAPEIREDIYEKNRDTYGRISEDRDGITLVRSHEADIGPARYWTSEA